MGRTDVKRWLAVPLLSVSREAFVLAWGVEWKGRPLRGLPEGRGKHVRFGWL